MKILGYFKPILRISMALSLFSTLNAQLNPALKPGENFDLSEWKLNYPMNNATAENLSSFTNTYFYTDATTGGMVFKCPNIVNETGGSSYPRCELRELLNKGASASAKSNNWTLSTNSTKESYGGYNGVLEATLSVDKVSSTYDNKSQVGRVIVGQIHADDNEPCRLYYRLLPGHKKGSVYFAHEQSKVWGDDKQEFWHELIGSRSSSASEPSNGIELGERWSYKIDVRGESMTVSIYNSAGTELASKTISSSMTGEDNFDATYANSDNYLYFKAGVYNQNNGGEASDYAQATFYALSNTHPTTTDPIPDPSISVSPLSLNYAGEAGSETIRISSTTNWTCSSEESWITISTQSGSGNASVAVSVEENPDKKVRTGTVRFVADDDVMLSVHVSQGIIIPEGQIELPITSATASIENTSKGEVAANVLDNDLTTIWAGNGSSGDPTLDLQLNNYYMVSAIEIGFSKQEIRDTYFSVQYWDGTKYVDILMHQTQTTVDASEATTLHAYYFPEAVATNKIRVIGHGNSDSEWNSYREVNLYGWECTNCSELGLNTIELNTLQIVPNPCHGSFIIENCSGAQLQVLSLSGAVVFKQKLTSNYETVFTALPQGVYLTKVVHGKQSYFGGKLIIR